MKFPTPQNPTGVRAFLGTIGITRRWIPNFSELSRPLSRLTGKVDWRWFAAEQLSFDLLKIKSTTMASMYGYDPSLPVHFYTDASGFAGGLAITQFRPHEAGQRYLEVPIEYDSFTFTGTQRKYATYKRELCALTKFVLKYDYLCKHPRNTRPLTYSLKSDAHEGSYGHWADRLRGLHISIQYIPRRRNRVADGLSRTLFRDDNCKADPEVEEAAATLGREGPQWVWKDGKDGYEAFLEKLGGLEKEEVLATLHGVNVFFIGLAAQVGLDLGESSGISSEERTKASWKDAYLQSEVFLDIYRLHTVTDLSPPPLPGTFQRAMNYRLDPDTGLLYIFRHVFHLPCIPEAKILSVLRLVHGALGKTGHTG